MRIKVNLGGFSTTRRALFKLRAAGLVLRHLLPVARHRDVSLARRAKVLARVLRFTYHITRLPAEVLALWVWQRRVLIKGSFMIKADDELLIKSGG